MKRLQLVLVCFIVFVSFVIALLRIGCFIYPNDYELTVKKYAKVYDVPEELVFSVIKAESNYQKSATSAKGAMGLMQIMSDTGAWASEKINIEDFSDARLYEPEVNIEIGCFYLSYLMDLYSDNIKNALAAYNAGPSNVDKWLKTPKYSSDGKNLDKIPFVETERYIKKVMKNIKIYDFLY